jgi:hypothetical protein
MRIRLAIPDELTDEEREHALNAALEAVTRTVTPLVARGIVPPAAKVIKAGGVKWAPEPPGDEHFDLPQTVIGRRWGDCDDLAPWHAGSLRAAGIDPHARAIVRKSGPSRWHAEVLRGSGKIDDPSLAAGMGHNVSGDGGGVSPINAPMSADGRLCVALCPTKDPRHPMVWFARCDVSDRFEPWAWSSAASHPNPIKALVKTIKTVRGVAGDELDDEDDARLAVLNDLILGREPSEVSEALGELMEADPEYIEELVMDGCHSVGFLSDVWKGIKKGASSVAKVATPYIPGYTQAKHLFAGRPGDAFKSMLDYGPTEQLRHFAATQQWAQPYIQQGIPLAAGSFFGPAGAAAGSMYAQHVAPQRPAPRPGPAPAPMDPRLLELARRIAAEQGAPFTPPTFTYEPGMPMRPWGAAGPAVMRF